MMQRHDLCVRMGAKKRAYWHKISHKITSKEFYLAKFHKILRFSIARMMKNITSRYKAAIMTVVNEMIL